MNAIWSRNEQKGFLWQASMQLSPQSPLRFPSFPSFLNPYHAGYWLACVAWRFCRAGCTSGEAAKFARKARENERLPPQSPHGFSALARLYYLATKTAMLRWLKYHLWYLCQISLQIMLLPILISCLFYI